MLWYNGKTNALQSTCPAGGWASEAFMAKNYPDWKKVEDSFVPPVKEVVVSKEERLATLDAEYEASKQELANAYLDAMLHSDKEMAESIKEDLAVLDAEYDETHKAIEGE